MELLLLLVAFFLGAALGSFINVVVDRLPNDRSLLTPPSHCEACGLKLSPVELVPVFSFLFLKGRCRSCGVRLPNRLFAVELGSALLMTVLMWLLGPTLSFAFTSFWILFFATMALIDIETGWVLDVMVYGGTALALALIPIYPGLTLASSLLGGGIGLAALLLPALLWRQGMGWGDVKLSLLYGLLAGWPGVIVFLVLAFVSGGVVAGTLLALGRGRKTPVPFVPFLSFGAAVALLWGRQLWDWYTGLL